MSFLAQINKEIEDFKTKQIQIVPGLYMNQYDIVHKIHFYYNSKFVTGELDSEGDRKYFENINKNPCKVCSKAIDFDTKNIRLLTAGGGDPLKTWFFERDLKYWMRDQNFGKTLNRIFKEIPIFGTVVLKVVNGTPYFVDLRNFVVMQTADDLDCSNFTIEIHNKSVQEFRTIAKEMKWPKAKVDETIKKFHEMKETTYIRIYERYGEVPDVAEDGTTTYTYRRVFWADVGIDVYDDLGNMTAQKSGVELSSEEWDGTPYWEFHMEKMPGRWLGIGVVETLFEPQVRINELTNLQSKTSYWAALRLFFSKDAAMAGNLMTEKRNGDVITGDSEITQIDMSDRNLAFFNDQHQKWMANRAELTFSYDVVQGERLPAGTPLGSAQIAVSQTLSYFEGIQESIALDLKEMLYEVIIPQFEKDNSVEHTLRIVGQDLDQYIAMVKNELTLKEVLRVSMTGEVPTNAQRDLISVAVEEAIKQGKEKILTIPKSFYEGIKYDVDIDITGESVDTRVRAATKFAIAQMITADPTMTTDPFKRKLLMSYMEDGGINPNEFFGVETKTPENIPIPGRAGGGVSAAPQISQAVPGQVATTV